MGVDKIIYVTPGERDHNGLTSMSESQLIKVKNNVLEGKEIPAPVVFRSIESYHPSKGSLEYLSSKCSKTTQDTRENLFLSFISNPIDINDAMRSTREGKTIVVGVTQEELRNLLDALKHDGYDVVNKDKINWKYNIYAVTIDPNTKKDSRFFKAAYK